MAVLSGYKESDCIDIHLHAADSLRAVVHLYDVDLVADA